jgi:hypothetical protein
MPRIFCATFRISCSISPMPQMRGAPNFSVPYISAAVSRGRQYSPRLCGLSRSRPRVRSNNPNVTASSATVKNPPTGRTTAPSRHNRVSCGWKGSKPGYAVLPEPLLQQHKHIVNGIGMACHGNTNAVELFSVISALDARDDFLVMHRRPVSAVKFRSADTRLSRCLPRPQSGEVGVDAFRIGGKKLRQRDASGRDQSRHDLAQSWTVARIRVSASPGRGGAFAMRRIALHRTGLPGAKRPLDLQAKQESEAPQGKPWSS